MSHLVPLCLLWEDEHLGRLDYASFSQQTLMEMVIEGIENKQVQIIGTKRKMRDVEKWKRVKVNAEKEIIKANWGYYALEGSVDLRWLPSTIQTFILQGNRLTGSIDLTKLPEELLQLDLSSNSFSGEIDLENLPPKLVALMLLENSLSGSLHLEKLPASILDLSLAINEFSGSVNLEHLPPKMTTLDVSRNEIEGSVDFSKIPKSMNFLNVSYTKLSGSVTITFGEFHVIPDKSRVKCHCTF
uniref:Leucine-rich repeat protein n=1 Tax=Paramoeba aestuarina TaxID=180227 RepID=A0A7S4KU35_9EUKA|mmetsp:Transcript_25255/g.39416  ORF Transcript_25255/g.39416 Transcript_25255/m.39416 type:complete len:243 (+) Transcript_25255:33-761(+)